MDATREQLESNKADRIEAEEFVAMLGDKPIRFWEVLAHLANGKAQQSKPAPVAAAPQTQPPRRPPGTVRVKLAGNSESDKRSRVDYALQLAEQIESAADEVPDEGQEFASDVAKKAEDIAATIESTNRASDAQVTALENMLSGLQRWIRD